MVLYLTIDNESFLYGDPVEATDNHNVARPTDAMTFIFVATLLGPREVQLVSTVASHREPCRCDRIKDKRLLNQRLNCLLVSIQTVVCLSVLVP